MTYAASAHVSKKSPPEIHAEARALALAAASPALSVAGATAYITFPPCDGCFHLLAAARVARVVFRNELRSAETRVLACALEVELVEKGTAGARASPNPAATYPPGAAEVAGKAWDEWLRNRAAEAWGRMGETGDVTKARNARFYQQHAEESAKWTGKVHAAEAAEEARAREEKVGAGKAGGVTGKKTKETNKETVMVVAEADVEVAPAGERDVPAKRAASRDELKEGVAPVAKVAKVARVEGVEPAP